MQAMLPTKVATWTTSTFEAFQAIGSDVWIGPIVETFEEFDITRLRAVSKSFRIMMSDDDLWLDKLTMLSIRHPSLADVAKGDAESCYDWYGRCCSAADDECSLALRHKKGERPYLKLYGKIDGSTFTPYAPLGFPVPRGLIAELIVFKAEHSCKDAPMDALEMFSGAPKSADHAFRKISKKIFEVTRRALPTDLRSLPDDLAELYAPGWQAVQVEVPTERRALDMLQRRLGHVSAALASSEARVAMLEAENEQLRNTVAQRDARIVELEAEVARLKAELKCERNRSAALERVLASRPTQVQLDELQGKLQAERAVRVVAERRIAKMEKERSTLCGMLTMAEKDFAVARAAADAAEVAESEAKGKGARRAAELQLKITKMEEAS